MFDYVAAIKICQGQLYFHYSNPTTKHVSNVFKEFQDLVAYNHNKVHLKCKTTSLDIYVWIMWASRSRLLV